MRNTLSTVMSQRGERLARILAPHLPECGRVLDIGSGTGHNGVAIQHTRPLSVVNLDVSNMHVVGERPALFDGYTLPFPDRSFQGAILLFVLHYCADPVQLLREVRRVTAGTILVLQSTYRGRLAETLLRLYDFGWGPVAFAVARAARLISAGRCRLYARALATRPALDQIFAQAGLAPELVRSECWPFVTVRRDLFVLRRLT
jgi:SAM-dependent methyltransferase